MNVKDSSITDSTLLFLKDKGVPPLTLRHNSKEEYPGIKGNNKFLSYKILVLST